MAIAGVALLALGIGPRVWITRELRRQGQPSRPAWRRVYLSPTAWFGIILIAGAISPVAGAAALAVVMVWAGVVIVELLVHGVRGVWRLPTAVRLIGDPDAWKGIRRPYWDRSANSE
jgi:hypothetical protein